MLYFRVINLLLGKGYIELEETLLQWKQKSHLMARLEVSYYVMRHAVCTYKYCCYFNFSHFCA